MSYLGGSVSSGKAKKPVSKKTIMFGQVVNTKPGVLTKNCKL